MNKSHNPINSTYYFTDQDDTDATDATENAAVQVVHPKKNHGKSI